MGKYKEVSAAIIFQDDKVLIARRAPDQKLAGYWEFAGGKKEAGETIEDCLVRELREELGVHVLPMRIVGTSDYSYEHGQIRLIGIEARILSGDLHPTVHDKLQWVAPEDLTSYRLAPADIPLALLIREQHAKA